MNGTQTLIAILGVAALAAGGWCWKTWLSYQTRDRQIEFEATIKQQEFERYRIFADFARRYAGQDKK